MFIEMISIALQPLRGGTSHFNVTGPLDALLWQLMMSGIVVATLVMAYVAFLATSRLERHKSGPVDFSTRSVLWILDGRADEPPPLEVKMEAQACRESTGA